MCDAMKLKATLKVSREPILSKAAKKKMNVIARSPVQSRKFLTKVGIYDRDGRLTEHYR